MHGIPTKENLEIFGRYIRQGELVAFPTETVYGLGANALDATAVKKIFEAKNRPADNPLIVHVASLAEVKLLVTHIDELSLQVLQKFSPGPITVLLPRSAKIPDIVTAGSPLVGIRIPGHEIALAFLRAANVPIAAPSANKSGKPSATHHSHVIEAFGSEVPNVIEAGATTLGVESTVVMSQKSGQLLIMRQGAITKEALQRAFPQYAVLLAQKDSPELTASPGTRYRHYAPEAAVEILPLLTKNELIQEIGARMSKEPTPSQCIVLCTKEVGDLLPKDSQKILLGSEHDLYSVTKNLYAALLQCDTQKVTKIFIQSFPEEGIGRTVMERIKRAALKQ